MDFKADDIVMIMQIYLMYVYNGASNKIKKYLVQTVGRNRFQISDAVHLIPSVKNYSFNLMVLMYRWSLRVQDSGNVDLSNEGSSNDVDGTWGSYTARYEQNTTVSNQLENVMASKYNLI